MNDAGNNRSKPPSRLRAHASTALRLAGFWGIVAALGSTLGYSLATAFLRQASEDPPIWVSAVKATCTAAIFIPWWIAIVVRGKRRVLPPLRIVGMLFAVALFVQICGNYFYQLALNYIGMALAVPLALGAMVFSAAVLARILMAEPLTPKIAIGLSILVAAIAILSLGARKASLLPEIDGTFSLAWLWGAVMAIISGVAYAVLGLALRQSTKHQIPMVTPIVFVSVTGALLLPPLSLYCEGWEAIRVISAGSWWAMIAAGVFNAVSFLALVQALKLLPVVYVNAINTLQVVASALIGLLWFYEPWTNPLTAGLILTGAGLGFMAYAAHDHRRQTRPQPSTDSVALPEEAEMLIEADSPEPSRPTVCRR